MATLKVFIARGTSDVGRFPREQLPELARKGVIRRTDTYWHKGMDGWEPISDLLGPSVWEPGNETLVLDPIPARAGGSGAQSSGASAPAAAQESSETPPARRTAWGTLAAISVGALIALVALGYFLIKPDTEPMEPATATSGPAAPAVDMVAIRNKALADLQQRIERLPKQPAPPLNTYYYDVGIELTETFQARTPCKAIIRGRENVLKPDSEETLARTEFTLTADYTDGEWVYKKYRGTTLNTQDRTTSVLQHDETRLAPPVLVGILGLKTADFSRSSTAPQR
jgi:hypothetical protein